MVPVTAARGRSQKASAGWRCSGLVQMAFWSSRIRFGVPSRVIGSGFGSGEGVGVGSLWGSGASGKEADVPVVVVGREGVLWAEQTPPVASRREAVSHREALNLG
jgi:hypothetical protein